MLEAFRAIIYSFIIATFIYLLLKAPIFLKISEYTGTVVNKDVNSEKNLYSISVKLNTGKIPIINDRDFFMKAPRNKKFGIICTRHYSVFKDIVLEKYEVKE